MTAFRSSTGREEAAEILALHNGDALEALRTMIAERDAVEERLAGGRRPLLTDGIASWRRIAAERAPLYAALADVVVDTSRRPMTRIAAELADAVRAREAEPAR